jgi:Reverse transcriptase (RNA-dependent DNA polymerase)
VLLKLIDQITSEIEKGYISIGFFIDLSKALDTIDHRIMLDKLQMYGIRGCALNWLSSYLSDRNQYVALNKFKSTDNLIKCDVPQGSILGLLLYYHSSTLVLQL